MVQRKGKVMESRRLNTNRAKVLAAFFKSCWSHGAWIGGKLNMGTNSGYWILKCCEWMRLFWDLERG